MGGCTRRVACSLAFLVLVAGCSCGTAQSDAPKPATPVVAPSATTGFTLRILGWNVESGGNDPRVIATQLSQFSSYGIVALSEVHPNSFDIYKDALGDHGIAVMSESGRGVVAHRLSVVLQRGACTPHCARVGLPGMASLPSDSNRIQWCWLSSVVSRLSTMVRFRTAIGRPCAQSVATTNLNYFPYRRAGPKPFVTRC